MLENDCDLLDMKILGELALKDNEINREDVNQNIQKMKQIHTIEYQAQDCHEKICLVQEAIKIAILKGERSEADIRSIYEPRILHLQQKLANKVINLKNLT